MKFDPPIDASPLGFAGATGGAAGLLNALIRSLKEPMTGFSGPTGGSGCAVFPAGTLLTTLVKGPEAGISDALTASADDARFSEAGFAMATDSCFRARPGSNCGGGFDGATERPFSSVSCVKLSDSRSFLDRLDFEGRGGVSGSYALTKFRGKRP